MSTSLLNMRVNMRALNLMPILAVAAATLVAGCTAQRDSIVVGAIPDDYRTNHPIVIEEKQEKIDIPVGLSDYRMTKLQRSALAGFLARYDGNAAPTVQVMVPQGSANQAAASRVAADFVAYMTRNGVPQNRIVHQPYHAPADSVAPIRVTYAAMRAQVASNCGRWPEDMLARVDNKHWANFGCSYQNNLAAQMANPADLLAPRQTTPIDAENRSNAIDQYQRRQVAPEFLGTSEINY